MTWSRMNKIIRSLSFAALALTITAGCAPTEFSMEEKPVVDAQGATDAVPPGVTDGAEVIRSLEPTLAVRGMGCVNCHAKVASNIVTDFGAGDPWFFGQTGRNWNNGAPYGDHGSSMKTMDLETSATIFVPRVDVPDKVKTDTGLTTVADYMMWSLQNSKIAATKAAQVEEKSSIYIGAPTAADIDGIFNLNGTSRIRYLKSNEGTLPFSGLTDAGRFFRNTGTLVCDGDVALRGPLLLENLVISSVAGCRIYVVGSVFIYGPITYTNGSDKRNLQITASRSISLGLGSARKNGEACETNSRYAAGTTDASYSRGSTLLTRYVDLWTVPAQSIRGFETPKEVGQDVVDEAALIEESQGTLYDASCRPEGRNVGFERILLNAPLVHSRYIGDVKGTIIAEYALMSLNNFKFHFDDVFKNVDVLPRLPRSKYLSITN